MKTHDFFNPKSPLIIIGDLPPAPLTASFSGVSDAANSINDEDERLSLTLILFPTQACTDIRESSPSLVGKDNGSNQDQETAPATGQGDKGKSVLTSGKTCITRVDAERLPSSSVPRKNKQPFSRREEEENHYPGVSTELVLYEDPWKIKKTLKASDVGNLARLLLPQDCVETHVFRWMGADKLSQVKSTAGMGVAVRDADTGDERRLVFRRWKSWESYVLNGGWTKEFVKRRGLEVDDEIGMLWDADARMFYFKVLRKAAHR